MRGEKKANKELTKSFVLGGLIGAALFVYVYGINVLNVTYDAWLMEGVDLSQHYLGWTFFRNSSWTFPIGLVEGVLHPNKISIIYLDSIPIFAILFKILSPILPDTFQYFGVWGIFCFVMQGGISAIIVRKYIHNYIAIGSAAGIFVMSSTVLQRMFGHTALAGQWILLLGICVWIYDSDDFKKRVLVWNVLLALSVFIHMYFAPMLLAIAFFDLIRISFRNKKWKIFFVAFISNILTILFSMYILGAFVGGGYENVQPGLGLYSANLNCLFNSMGMSVFLNELPIAFEQQYEGFAYLGFGGIFLFFYAVLSIIVTFIKKRKIGTFLLVEINNNVIFAMLTGIVLIVFALSPVGTINQYVLYSIKMPEILIRIFSIFRSTGRFVWPVMYGVTAWSIITIGKRCVKRKQYILFLALVLQIIDFSQVTSGKMSYYSQEIEYNTFLESNAWEYLSEKKELAFLTSKYEDGTVNSSLITEYFPHKMFFNLAYFAKSNGMVVNDFYIGRRNVEDIDEYKEELYKTIIDGSGKDDIIYLFSTLPVEIIKENKLNVYYIDGIYVGLTNELPGIYIDENCMRVDLSTNNSLFPLGSKFILNGFNENHTVTLNKDGVLYGPYLNLPRGSYEITILGNGLEWAYYDVISSDGTTLVCEEIYRDTNCINYRIKTENDISNTEFRVVNTNSDNIAVMDILVKYFN